MEDEIEYDDEYNYEDEYNQEEEIYEDNSKKEKKHKMKESSYDKPNIDYEIIQNSEIIKKREGIIEKFVECSCLKNDEAELVLIFYTI